MAASRTAVARSTTGLNADRSGQAPAASTCIAICMATSPSFLSPTANPSPETRRVKPGDYRQRYGEGYFWRFRTKKIRGDRWLRGVRLRNGESAGGKRLFADRPMTSWAPFELSLDDS